MAWSVGRALGRGYGRGLGWMLVVLVVFVAFVSYGRTVEGPVLRTSLAAGSAAAPAEVPGTGDTGDTGDTGGTMADGGMVDGGSPADAGSDAADGTSADLTTGTTGTAGPPGAATPAELAVIGTVLDAVASILPAAPSLGQVAGGNVIAVLSLLPPEVFDPVLQAYTALFDALNTGALSLADMVEQLDAALSPLAAFVNPIAAAVGGSAVDGGGAVLRGGQDGAALLGHHVSYLSWLADNLAVYKDTFHLD